jgi:hypothetical protein
MPDVDPGGGVDSARLSLTTMQADVTAPIVLTFVTGDRREYRTAENSMQLKIVFKSEMTGGSGGEPVKVLTTLEPMQYSGAGLAVDGAFDELKDAQQATCGKLFSEMWTNAPGGFPQPKGCYYNRDETDTRRQCGRCM